MAGPNGNDMPQRIIVRDLAAPRQSWVALGGFLVSFIAENVNKMRPLIAHNKLHTKVEKPPIRPRQHTSSLQNSSSPVVCSAGDTSAVIPYVTKYSAEESLWNATGCWLVAQFTVHVFSSIVVYPHPAPYKTYRVALERKWVTLTMRAMSGRTQIACKVTTNGVGRSF
jgi:hypothetical protein